ncbi:hypothetical protein EHQ27_12595 [Leptospira wolffii]|nr:hypothetical protein EHQ32_00305 [Leptospira wolffii]TGK69025.1 hypothetical protein EHQ27_12595 [Leptospira wolffii]TGK76901.1 hypothetical protein EHQ35_00910 [Leptospira wolffii]TGL26642.1 hypothetical protein EHQ57_18140 [Leptospira wolffii]
MSLLCEGNFRNRSKRDDPNCIIFFSINNQKDAYWREYDSLPSSYDRFGNTGKSIIAGINYSYALAVDLAVLVIVGSDLCRSLYL